MSIQEIDDDDFEDVPVPMGRRARGRLKELARLCDDRELKVAGLLLSEVLDQDLGGMVIPTQTH